MHFSFCCYFFDAITESIGKQDITLWNALMCVNLNLLYSGLNGLNGVPVLKCDSPVNVKTVLNHKALRFHTRS